MEEALKLETKSFNFADIGAQTTLKTNSHSLEKLLTCFDFVLITTLASTRRIAFGLAGTGSSNSSVHELF